MNERQTTERGGDGDRVARGIVPSNQFRVLELMKRGASTIAALAVGLSLNIETIRHHLKALEGRGYVERRSGRATGRGRPEVLYGLTVAAEALFPRREGEVLQALALHLKKTGNESLLEEFFAEWIDSRRGEALARVEGLEGHARLEEVARIMSELGFMASVGMKGGEAGVHLCHCPLRELVAVSRIPCRAELSLLRELLGQPLTRLAYIPAGDTSCSYRARVA